MEIRDIISHSCGHWHTRDAPCPPPQQECDEPGCWTCYETPEIGRAKIRLRRQSCLDANASDAYVVQLPGAR